MSGKPEIEAFFDEATNTVSYLVADPLSGSAAVIDPVLDFELASGSIETRSAQKILDAAAARGWTIALVLETHVHADHLSAARFITGRTGAKLGISARIREVQQHFAPMFGANDVRQEGGDFDLLLADGDRIPLGGLMVEVIATPGHTAADLTYRVGDALFVGDTIFMPDYGTARTDFPGGDARELYRSIHKLLALPPATRLFICHDYKAPGRDEFRWETTVGEQAERNVHVGGGRLEEDYVTMRVARDETLPPPKLLFPAIQVNIRGGRLPPPDAEGVHHLRIPIAIDETLSSDDLVPTGPVANVD